MRVKKTTLGLISLTLSMLLAACGGGGGGGGSNSATAPSGDSGGFTGTAVDPYIVGAVFEEIAADGVTVLQRESTPSNNQGQFSFSKSITPGSTISMKIGRKGLHQGTPYKGMLRRAIDSDDNNLVLSPLTTVLANGVSEQELLSALNDAGITGLTAGSLYADPVAPLMGQSSQITDQKLKLLHANMAINNLMEVRNDFDLNSVDLNSQGTAALLDELVAVNQDLLNETRFNELASDVTLTVGSNQPLLFDDVIKPMVGSVQTIVALIKEQPSSDNIDPTIIDNAVTGAQSSLNESVIAEYEQRIDVVSPVAIDGATVFASNCASCHTIDASGSMDLSNDGSLANRKISQGHMGITIANNELQALVSHLDNATTTDPQPVPDPTPEPTPTPANGQTLYDNRCAACHSLGNYDTQGAPDLSGSGETLTAKINAGHRSIVLTTDEVSAVTVWVVDNSLPAPTPDPTPDPVPTPDGITLYESECQGCHGLINNSDIVDRSELAIQNAIDLNSGGMGALVLTSEEIIAISDALPIAPPPEPESEPEPTPANGQELYNADCAGCHSLGDYDIDGFAADLGGNGAGVTTKIIGGHQLINYTTAELTALAAWADANIATSPEPTPVNGQTVYDDNCAGCHSINGYDADGFATDLASTGTILSPKLAAGHQSIILNNAEETELSIFVDQYEATVAGPDYSDCTACHAQPPTTGSHLVHNALPGIDCNSCHAGAEHNGQLELAFETSYNAKNSVATDNGDGTCSNISCHGGQITPDWDSGSLVVDTQCQSCHRAGTDEFNSYNSGEHKKHVTDKRYNCNVCHSTSKLRSGHFVDLATTSFDTDPATTIGGNSTATGSYNGATCSSVQCHGSENW